MRRLMNQWNHKGSTLLMVIICLAFLGILGSLMLSVSMVNLEMKTVESKSNFNFYTCEKALEEIKSGLEEFSAGIIQSEYEDVLKHYAQYTTLSLSARNDEVQMKVLNQLQTELGADTDKAAVQDRFVSYLSDKNYYTISVNPDEPSGYAYEIDSTGYDWLVFKNVRIQYKNNGYQNTITVDIRINIPDFTFTAIPDTITKSMDQQFGSWALVADGTISCEGSSGSTSITGNVYSGNGITVRDTLLSNSYSAAFDGNYLVTRGDIKAEDAATLSIGNISGTDKPIIWANNIKTDSTDSYIYSNNFPTRLNISQAICLVKDDLTLEARNSNVNISGAYVGYTKDSQADASGSSIVVNGAGSAMDLSGLSSLVLAGRAHVSVDSSVVSALSDIDIRTGESLAFKSNERAYLVPGKYITLNNGLTSVQALHNPITVKDLLSGTPAVLIGNSMDPVAQLNYYSYINTANQYKMVARQTTLGAVSTLRYYYLNFAGGIQADKFMTDYMVHNSGNLRITDAFSIGNVNLPVDKNNIVSAGNIMSYHTSDTEPKIYKAGLSSSYYSAANYDTAEKDLNDAIQGKKFSDLSTYYAGTDLCSSDSSVSKTISNLSTLYFNMTHYLTPTAPDKAVNEADQLVSSTVYDSGITQVNSSYSTGYTLDSGYHYYNSLTPINPLDNTDAAKADDKSVVVLTQDVTITHGSHFNGILITTGNITVEDNTVINGMIIAAGHKTVHDALVGKDVIVGNNVTVGNNVKVNGRIIATGNIVLGAGCIIDSTGNTSFTDANTSVDAFLENIFKQDADILWKMFADPEVSINVAPGSSISGLVDLTNLVSSENWRNH